MKLSYLLLCILFSCVSISNNENNDFAEKIKLYVESDIDIYVGIKIEYLKDEFNIALSTAELYWSYNDYEKMNYKTDFSKLIYNLLISKKPLIVDEVQFYNLRKHIVENTTNLNYTYKEIIESLDEYGCIKSSYKDSKTKSIIYWLVKQEIIVTPTGEGPCFHIEMLEKE